MQLLPTATLVLSLVQLIPAIPLRGSALRPSISILRSQKQLVKLYDKKVNATVGTVYKDLEHINDGVLEDKIVQEAKTPLMQKFKRDMLDFQEVYPFYEHLNKLELLVSIFSDMTKDYYSPSHPTSDKDVLYIIELMRKLGYDHLRNKYKDEFMKFVSENILPRFDNINQELSKKRNLTKFDIKFLKWVAQLRECEQYECYLNTFRRATLTPRDKFFNYIQRETANLIIRYGKNASEFAHNVYYHEKLWDLDTQYQTLMIEITIRWINQYEDMETISMIDRVYFEVLQSLVDAPLEQLYLITTILDESGFGEPELYYKQAYDNFLKYDLLKEFEKFKASLSTEELRREKQLLARVELLKKATTFMQRVEAFEFLQELDKRKNDRMF